MSMTVQKEMVHSEISIVGRVSDIHWETDNGLRTLASYIVYFFMLTERDVETEDFPDRLFCRRSAMMGLR